MVELCYNDIKYILTLKSKSVVEAGIHYLGVFRNFKCLSTEILTLISAFEG